MKKISYLTYVLIVNIFLFTLTGLKSDQNYMKYGVESGYISYVYEGGANGSKEVYFKDWGMTEIQLDNMNINVFGMTQKTNHVVLLKDTHITTFNKANNKTHKEKNKHIASLIKDNPYEKNLSKVAYSELEKDGGKLLGKRQYLNKECEIWEINGSRQLVWKGIPLKTELNVAGLKIVMKAVELKTDITIPDSIFKLQENHTNFAQKK